MRGVFLSYRHDDTSGHAGRLYDRLHAHFGADDVFMDVDSIEPGDDFLRAIRQKIDGSAVLIALIGDRWLAAADSRGRRRIDSPTDVVRLEIQTALERGIVVIPLLVEGATMPDAESLPEDLRALTRCNAWELRHSGFQQTVDALIERLESLRRRDEPAASPTSRPSEPLLPGPAPNRWKRRRWLIAALLCVTGGLLVSKFVSLHEVLWGPAAPSTTRPPARIPEKARILLSSAEEQRQNGRMDEARTLTDQALEICKAAKDELCRADALCSIARIATDRGDVDFAFHAYTEALPAYEAADLDRGKAEVSLGRGSLFADRQPLEAERLYREAINLFAKDMLGVATSRLKLGDLLRRTGRYYQAEHELDLAAAGFRKVGDDVGLAKTLASQAYLYSARDDFDRARDLMLKVNEISSRTEREKYLLRSVFHEWQGASLVRGTIGAAGSERLREAAEFAKLSGNTERIASVLTSQARYAMTRKEYEVAMDTSVLALKARDSPLGRADILLVQSQILAGREDSVGAVAIAQRAASLYSAARDELGIARAYGLLALLSKEHPSEAAAFAQRSQESLDQLGLAKIPPLPTDFTGLARRPGEGMRPAPTVPPGPEELGR